MIPTPSSKIERRPFERVVTGVCEDLGREVTPEVISLFHAYAATPNDAAQAILSLPPVSGDPTPIPPAEVRKGLTSLDNDRIVRGVNADYQDIIQTLLSKRSICDPDDIVHDANKATHTVEECLGVLEAAGLAIRTDGGWRLKLAFNTEQERQTNRMGYYVQDGPQNHKAILALKLVTREAVDDLRSPDWGKWTDTRRARDLRPLLDAPNPWVWINDIVPALWGVPDWQTSLQRVRVGDQSRVENQTEAPADE